MPVVRLNLTLAGFGRRVPDAPPPPSAPPPPPSPVSGARMTASQSAKRQTGSFNIRNVGGAQGVSVSSTMRALKSLTGQ